MAVITIHFEYRTGLVDGPVNNVRLTGNWDQEGKASEAWQQIPMRRAETGFLCDTYSADVQFSDTEIGKTFSWAVIADTPAGTDRWGVVAESDGGESPLHRTFVLQPDESGGTRTERYWVTPQYSLGANRYEAGEGRDSVVFSVWAPHAQKAETVTGGPDGYIRDDGSGVRQTFPMTRDGFGVWSTASDDPALSGYERWEGTPYMFRITRDDGSVAYRSDLLSRKQAGWGAANPETEEWSGRVEDLDSTKSCSVILDPRKVWVGKDDDAAMRDCVDGRSFWQDEFSSLRPIPANLADMVIYEMHIGGLGAGRPSPGTFADAIAMLDYLAELGINTVELLPVSNFGGVAGWGYGSAHFYADKYDYARRDQLKRFVKACHQRGIAVIVDVVYNHYYSDGDRCQWMYDSTRHSDNMFYYYHGEQEDYPDFPEGGYCDNMSTGYLPGVHDETVRGILIGSAVRMAVEAHVDGFRMDLTQALHSFNVLHKDGSPVPEANQAGIRFMREWARTLRLFKPKIILLAEDHSDWQSMVRPQAVDGVGFDASWWAEWYHQLIGDAANDTSKARLLKNAGFGTQKPLRMNMFAGMIAASAGKVVYHESHDESGNSEGSARTLEVAVNGMLFDNTRRWAEARARVVAGLTFFCAGTPMFFMGEEVGAVEPYRHDDFLEHREDFAALRESTGNRLFAFYKDAIRLRNESPALRSSSVEIIKVHNKDRLVCFRRWINADEYLVLATLNGASFPGGYGLLHKSLRGKQWKVLLNSDAAVYGGSGMALPPVEYLEAGIKTGVPPCCVLVFGRTG